MNKAREQRLFLAFSNSIAYLANLKLKATEVADSVACDKSIFAALQTLVR
ncbi:MAG: hypothetical protein KME57_21195 [Scytonema hyalinum WJT4-NPBG1]|jgi:hypothetical protein|nr:hypothetical protein [Scytonema hyalinum WJT4-NPBG1]